MLDVPHSFWDALGLGELIQKGGVSPADISAPAWTRAEVTWAAHAEAQLAETAADKRRAQKREEMRPNE